MKFTHIANPVVVRAVRIDPRIPTSWHFEFSDETEYWAKPDDPMLARYTPVVGDYLVTQEDGYAYFNPFEVFQRKYHTIEE
jgi:hypothetical protein